MDNPFNLEEESDSSLILEWDEEENKRLARSKKLYSAKENSKLVKQIIRMGIGNLHRPEIYLSVTCKDKPIENLRLYWPDAISQSSTPKYSNIINEFGYPNYELFTKHKFFENLLTIIKNQNHEVEFAPMIPCVTSILLNYYDECLTYTIIQSMINESNLTNKYFVMNKKNFIKMMLTIESIIQNNRKELYEHSKYIKLDFSEVSLYIIPILFSKKMNKNFVLTIFDSFMNEGRSVLIRYIIGFILYLEKELLHTTSPQDFMTTLYRHITSFRHASEIKKITSLAFRTDYIKRNKIRPIEESHNFTNHILYEHIKNHLPNYDDFIHQYSNAIHTYYGRRTSQITIDRMLYSKVNGGQLITNNQFWEIKQKMHFSLKRLNAYEIYRLSDDGSSFTAFLAKARNVYPCMLIIEASSGTIGAVLCNPIEPCYRVKQNGSPLTTVFELNNMKIYSHSKRNDFFLYTTGEYVSIGNGDIGGSAIYFKSDLETVVTDYCETFNSPPLLKSYREKIQNVELYKLAP